MSGVDSDKSIVGVSKTPVVFLKMLVAIDKTLVDVNKMLVAFDKTSACFHKTLVGDATGVVSFSFAVDDGCKIDVRLI